MPRNNGIGSSEISLVVHKLARKLSNINKKIIINTSGQKQNREKKKKKKRGGKMEWIDPKLVDPYHKKIRFSLIIAKTRVASS